MTTGEKDAMAKSPSTTSSAKSDPAMGALNAAARPPAAPAATRVRMPSSPSRPICPICEPSEAPIWIIGPSRPALPPEPRVRAEATAFTSGHACRGCGHRA